MMPNEAVIVCRSVFAGQQHWERKLLFPIPGGIGKESYSFPPLSGPGRHKAKGKKFVVPAIWPKSECFSMAAGHFMLP